MPKVKRDDIVWVEPRLVAEVSFAEWTHDGRLRAPVYQGLREDKAPEDVRREEPLEPEIRRGKRVLKLSNLDKPFWPEEGITKGDLIAYYRDVASVDRPAPAGPPLHDEAVSRRLAGEPLLPEGRALAHARLDSDASSTGRPRGRPGEADASLPARQRRAGAPLDGEHGLHRHEHLVLAGRQARAPGLRALRPRPVAGRRVPGGRPGGAPDQGRARRARPRRLPEDERRRRLPRARADRAPVHLRPDARVRRDRRRNAGAPPPRARHHGVGEGEAPRRARRREPERRGEDDRLGLFGAPAARERPSRPRFAGKRSPRSSIRPTSRWRSSSTACAATATSTPTCSRCGSPSARPWTPCASPWRRVRACAGSSRCGRWARTPAGRRAASASPRRRRGGRRARARRRAPPRRPGA